MLGKPYSGLCCSQHGHIHISTSTLEIQVCPGCVGEAESGGGFYPAVNRKSVRPTKDEVSKNEELAVVKSNGEGGVTSHNEQGGVHQTGNSASSREAQEDRKKAESEEEEEEVRPMKAKTIPKSPTAEEYRVHRLTHLPYRSWCPHCVKAKKRNPPHKKKEKGKQEERSIPVIAID